MVITHGRSKSVPGVPKLGNPTVINSLMETRNPPPNPPPYFLLTLFSVMLCTGATTSGTFSITA